VHRSDVQLFRSGPLGAVSITGLKADMPDWRLHQTGPIVLNAADQITRALGGRSGEPEPHDDVGGQGLHAPSAYH
jgi:hypothetical protein